MLTKNLEIILSALLTLRDKGPSFDQVGICSNTRTVLYSMANTQQDVEYSVVDFWQTWQEQVAPQWPLFSGEVAYPIPAYRGAKGDSNGCAAYYKGKAYAWNAETEYGAMRWEYLDWLIATLVEQDRQGR